MRRGHVWQLHLREEALATLPPVEGGDFTGERAVWEGKFHIV